MNLRHVALLGALLSLLISPVDAAAQSRCASGLCGDSSGSGGIRLSARNERFVQRSFTPAENSLHVLAGMERPGSLDLGGPAGLGYLEFGSQDVVTAVAGAAYGITRDVEVGAFLLPLQLSPDLEYNNPRVWATLSSSSDIGAAAIRIAGDVPFDGGPFVASLSVPLMLAFGGSAMFDFSPVVRASFGDPIGWVFEVPYRLAFNVTDEVFFGVHSGVTLPEFSGDALAMPLGGFVGYTVGNDPPAVDITVSFRFPQFMTALNNYAEPVTDLFIIAIGANGFLYF